jgi:leucyl aminopeptidase
MELKLIDKQIKDIKADIELIVVLNKNLKHRFVKDKEVLKKLDFEGGDAQSAFVTDKGRIYVGSEDDVDSIKVAVSSLVKKFASTNYKLAKIAIYDENIKDGLTHIVEGIVLGSYEFNQFKSESKQPKNQTIKISAKTNYHKKREKEFEKLQVVFKDALSICNAVNMTRDIVNTPPDDFYPQVMAKKAKDIASKTTLKCKILEQDELEKQNFGALLAVARASVHEPKVIHLVHKPKKAKKKIILVGKGLTYDSGGLSLKPSNAMTTMKSDKSGASAVLGIMQAVSELNLPVEVHGICGAVENMIGGNAYKPDDVLVSKSGTTIEVQNTDAEGRLVLADCLTYAQEQIKGFDYIFDMATLTGACVVALGEYTTGIMGHSNRLKLEMQIASIESGELAGVLPFNKYLEKTLKSNIADTSNISNSRYGGAITAGLFLDKFIEKENKDKWLHLDIAGPAFVEKPWGYNPAGASGAGVRLVIKFLQNLI